MPRVENSDQDWSEFGKTDPYFAVLTSDRFRKDQLTQENLALFYQSGEDYVNRVLRTIHQHFAPQFKPARALDFGCGVGRLTIPLARISDTVTGMDVSDAMLSEAHSRSLLLDIYNIQFVKSDDQLSALSGKYDFIVSSLVFQHIPPARGEKILARLLSHLNEGGVCVVQFLYHRPYQRFYQFYYWFRQNIPFFKNVANLLQGKAVNAPFMQMNTYDVRRLFSVIQKANGKEVYCQMEEHEGFESVTVYVRG
jgi:2-polyprenyl-3-methyl-5-hydroxy-6-metoxy-1,4-benzoquinol methylase